MVKGLKMKGMNRNLKNTLVKVRPFPGPAVKQLHHYVVNTLTDNTPGTIIIQGGCNDVSNKNSNPEDITKSIGSLGNLCRSHGVNQVLISPLLCRRNFLLNNKVKRIIFLLKGYLCSKLFFP